MSLEDDNYLLRDDMLREEHRILGWRVMAEREAEAFRVARNRRLLDEVRRGRDEFERARGLFDSFMEG